MGRMLNVSCDISGPVAALEQLLGEDLPFTIARFLTMQAQTGQEAARADESKVFTLRNDWTVRNTRITPAKKDTLVSEVYTDTSNRSTGAPDYLPVQQEGGEKVPLAGHRYLAIPTRYLRKIASGIIPDALRPKNLLPPGANLGETYSGSFATKTTRPRRAIGRDARKKLGNSDFVAFVQKTKTGVLCIFIRHGGIGYHGGTQDAEPWYTLIPSAHIKARFPMEDIVARVVQENAEKNFDRAAAEVLVNRVLSGGVRMQF